MTGLVNLRRLAMGAFAGALAVMLSGCLLMPGKFVSEMVLMKDGSFSYTYNGEIHLLSMSKLAKMGKSASGEFTPDECYDKETYEERECTADELAGQKDEFEQKKARKDREAEEMRAMFGGIDPSDPKSAEALAERLQRQAGFDSVVSKGDGLFDVSFHVEGRMDYDFVFPTIERFPMMGYFVMANRRDDGSVRIDAPGFSSQANGNPMMAALGGMNMAGAGKGDAKQGMPPIPQMDGIFTIVTDGQILANNTDEGPSADPRGQKLTWQVNSATTSPPTALIKLTQ